MPKNICNICGSALAYKDGRWVCPACGAPSETDITGEEESLLYNAAQKLRLADFGEAEEAYRDIVRRYPDNSAAWWGLVLAKNGIKYEIDADGTAKPTCYAASLRKIYDDTDFKRAIALCADKQVRADMISRAERLDEIREIWLKKVSGERPYDVFLCFKDSDDVGMGRRTDDSYEVANLYAYLCKLGYNVFFSRESLRDKVAEEYEPYIYNAIDTAKVMVVYGSKADYFNSTWMHNEWSRFRCRVECGDKQPNALVVVCDKGLDVQTLPHPLNKMQVLNATLKTFYGDLVSHIRRVVGANEPTQGNLYNAAATVAAGQLQLADTMLACRRFELADKHFAKALQADKNSFRAAWGKFLCAVKCINDDELTKLSEPFFERAEYADAFARADSEQKQRLADLCTSWAAFHDKHKYDEPIKQILRLTRAERGVDIPQSDVLLETIPQFVDMMQRAISGGGAMDNIVAEQFRTIAKQQKTAFVARYVPTAEQRRQTKLRAEVEARRLFASNDPTGYSHEGALYVKRACASVKLSDLLCGAIDFANVIDIAERLGTLAEDDNLRKLALAQQACVKLQAEIDKRQQILDKMRKGGKK